MYSFKFGSILLVTILILSSCSTPTSNEDNVMTGTVTDVDGNEYRTVKIGEQWWMAENLKVTHYRDNSPIAYVADSTEWANMASGAYCNYDNDSDYTDTYGSLYNWFAVADRRGLAPQGWRVPTDEDWKQLEIFIGMSREEADLESVDSYRGTDEGDKLKASSSWDDGGNGNDLYDFSALAAGFRADIYNNGSFLNSGKHAWIWTSTEGDNLQTAWLRKIKNSQSGIGRNSYTKTEGLSIRCIKE